MHEQRLASYIEHTCLRPDATREDIERLCREAREEALFGVCINGCWVEEAREFLDGTEVKVVTVAGFPLGANEADVKRFEVEAAADAGAHEIDVVLNVARLKMGDHRYVLRELRDVVEAADERPVKVIIETGLLSDEEKRRAAQLIVEAGAHFVKTCTGFSKGVATVEDVALLRGVVGPKFGIKASAGIREAAQAWKLIEAGATRIGTSAGAALAKDGG